MVTLSIKKEVQSDQHVVEFKNILSSLDPPQQETLETAMEEIHVRRVDENLAGPTISQDNSSEAFRYVMWND